MKGLKPFPVVGLGIILCALLLSGCSSTPQNGPSALNISTQKLPQGAEGDSYSQTLQASGGLLPYTWTLDSGALPPGFTFSSSGVLSGTPPAGSASTYSFTVRVTDSQSPVKAFQTTSFTLVINPPLSFPATTLPNGIVAVSYSSAVVATGGITPYTYSVLSDPGCLFTNTANCSSNGGLTLNADGTITGTPTGPTGTFNFTVQVTDTFPTTATANFSVTINGRIQGNYAFSFNGYNQQGQAFYMVGSFVADGNGNITSGVFDRNGNDSVGAVTDVAMTPGAGANGQCPIASAATGSVYCVGRSGVMTGSNLGTIVIASALGTYSFSVSVSLVTDSRIILADPNNPGVWGSGVLKPQGQSLAGVSLVSSNFAFGLSGVDASGNPYGGAGYFVTDASGNITAGNGEADLNDNGAVQSQVSLTGSLQGSAPFFNTSTGRGTATLTIGSSTVDYAFYVVGPSTGKLFPSLLAVQTDAASGGAPVTLASVADRGPAGGGTTAFSNLFLNATRGGNPNGVVFELNATSTAGGAAVPDISLGLGNFDGNVIGDGHVTSYALDENNGGVLSQPSYTNATYSVDKTSGRVTLSGLGTYPPVWYLVTFNTGFVVGTDPNVTVGTFEPQTAPSTGFTILSLFGNFYGGTSAPVLASVINEAEALVASPPPPPGSGNGTFAGTYDSSGTTGVMMNQMFTDVFCLADGNTCPSPQQTQSSTGRLLILDSSGNPAGILYLISAGASGATNAATKSVLLSTGAEPSLTVLTH